MKLAFLLMGAAASAPVSLRGSDSLVSLSSHAYTYFYPMLVMDETRVQQIDAGTMVPNKFSYSQSFVPQQSKTVVRPNVDTLYTSSWLDLSTEPIVMSLPDTHGRFYEVQMLDAWTNTFAAPGKRTSGTDAQNILVSGPSNKSGSCLGLSHLKLRCIDAPTSSVLALGRIQTNGTSDYSAVHEVQKGFKLAPLSKWTSNNDIQSDTSSKHAQVGDKPLLPPAAIAALSAKEFFSRGSSLLLVNPAPLADESFLQSISELGIVAGKEFQYDALSDKVKDALDRAVVLGVEKINKIPEMSNKLSRPGWSKPNPNLGKYGTNYQLREEVAVIGLFANTPEDAVYLNVAAVPDSKGKGIPLAADRVYTLTFDKGNLPPVGAFWSVTLYDEKGYMIENAIDRYALHSWDSLEIGADGSTTITISAKVPATGDSNWLPAPSDGISNFVLTARFYWPSEQIIAGKWQMPAVHAVGAQSSSSSALLATTSNLETTSTTNETSDASASGNTFVVVALVASAVVALAAVGLAIGQQRRDTRTKRREPMLSLHSAGAEDPGRSFQSLATPTTVTPGKTIIAMDHYSAL